MPSSTRFTRVAALGTAAVLTSSALVAATATPAGAGTGDTTYTCNFPLIGQTDVPVSATVPDLPDTPAGAPIAAGSLDPDFVFDTTNIASVLALVTSPSATGMALGVGEQSVPLQGFAFGALSGSSLPASATSGEFNAPATAGDHDVTMPDAFTFTGMLPGIPSPTPVSAPCVTDAPAVLGTLTVLGGEPGVSESTTEATLAKKRIVKGRKAKITATVTLSPVPLPPPGEVVVKKGKRTIGRGTPDESGAVTIRTKAFKKKGRYSLKVKYLGEPPLVTGSKDTVVLRVTRRR